jgi:hypothetical protein
MGSGGMAASGQGDLEQRLPGRGQTVKKEILAHFPGGQKGGMADVRPASARRTGGGEAGKKGATLHVSLRLPN